MNRRPTPATYGEWQGAYDVINRSLFNDELPQAIITLQRKRNSMGYLAPQRFISPSTGEVVDEIAINPTYFVGRTLEDILSTLAHEMCHLWQMHFGEKKPRRAYHNKEFAQKMQSIGLVTSHNGRPDGKRVGERMSHYIQKGGPFLDVAHHLIHEKNWRISFGDRFTDAGIPAKIKSRELEGVPGSESGFIPGVVIEKEPNKQKNLKIKYECSCEKRVWGKPGLTIICGECKSQFKEMPPANREPEKTSKPEAELGD